MMEVTMSLHDEPYSTNVKGSITFTSEGSW